MPATFFVPGWVAEAWPDRFREIVRAGHEVGHHGYLHELFFDKSVDEQRAVINRSQEIFRELVGHGAVGYRTPSGDFSHETPRLLLELGFSYSSSMRGDDRPYPVVIETRPSALIEIPTHSELDDFVQFGYNYFPVFPKGQDRIAGNDAAFDIWRHELDGYHRFGLCLVTVMHPQVIGTPGRIRLLERFIRYAQSYGDIWFARGAEIADWSRAHHSVGRRAIRLPDV